MDSLKEWMARLRAYAAKRGYTCDICGKELFDYPKTRVCCDCEELLWYNNKLRCKKCGRETITEGVCLACKSHVPAFTKGYSVFSYVGASAKLINGLKNGNRRLAWYLGEKIAEYFAKEISLNVLLQHEWLLVPVPLTAQRLQERGYNQAEELAVSISHALQAQGVSVQLDTELLQKKKETAMQKHLSARDRFENVVGVYHVHKRKACKDKQVLLVDDILTTGATGNACAKLMLTAGAKNVYFLTAASAPEKEQEKMEKTELLATHV